MFRKLNIIFFIIFLFGLILMTSCDGRKSSHQALKESIESFKKEASIEVNQYFPEDDFESKIDTILDSGYRINIKTLTDPKSDVVITKIKDTINYQNHYRNFIFDLKLSFKGSVLISEKFTKERVNGLVENVKVKLNQFDHQVLNAINVDFEKSSDNIVILELIYRLPETDSETQLEMHIKPNGNFEIISI